MNPEQSSLIPIVGPIIGGSIAASAGMLLAWLKRRRDGRDRFLVAIAEIETDLPEEGDVQEFHRSSLKPLRLAINSVQPYVSAEQFSRLSQLWIQYRKMGNNKELDWMLNAVEQIAENPKLKTVTPISAKLAAFFDRFKETVG